ncbi:hypothetical protein, partial [Legionella pneumophila]|uniref:hypothetical protein n=1 Tax=Legionella pneumophila TaxID=446 RepID=UPI0020BF71D6
MRDFDALAVAGKQHGVIAHDVATAHGGKTDGAKLARAGLALARIDRSIGQLGALRFGHDLA